MTLLKETVTAQSRVALYEWEIGFEVVHETKDSFMSYEYDSHAEAYNHYNQLIK
jgi:hypothetical protein